MAIICVGTFWNYFWYPNTNKNSNDFSHEKKAVMDILLGDDIGGLNERLIEIVMTQPNSINKVLISMHLWQLDKM